MMPERRVALVTGSSSGIGEATARALAAAGYRVVVNSARSVDAGRAVASSIDDGLYVQGDIADEAACRSIVDATIDAFGRLDVLVNNAGFTVKIPHADLDAITEQTFRRVFEVNVLGTWQMTRAALPRLRETGNGAVVNVSSIAGQRPVGSCIPYAASKAAVDHMTRLLANVTGPEVRVNAVAPGLILTPWTDTGAYAAEHARVQRRSPLGRTGNPEEVAKVIIDVAHSTYLTGEVILVDGGVALR